MVSNASEDLPEPDRPVITISRLRGRVRSMFLRLCSRAPLMTIASRACEGAGAILTLNPVRGRLVAQDQEVVAAGGGAAPAAPGRKTKYSPTITRTAYATTT